METNSTPEALSELNEKKDPRELRILFLEDNKFDFELVRRELARSGLSFEYTWARNRQEFIDGLESFEPDIILSDHSLPQFDSLSALKIVKKDHAHIPFILVTGTVSEEFAVKSIKEGAEDYILKTNLTRLAASIAKALDKKDLVSENVVIKKLNEELRHTYQELARRNRDITESIQYAEKIQMEILPDLEVFQKVFPDSFILYKPKDIVSGDFYWFHEHGHKFMFSVVDCTGHGVPGALLSMTGFHLLNEIVHRKREQTPSVILKELDAGVKKIFNSVNRKEGINDGMDMIFCSFDKKDNTLEFASAKRPLYHMRNGNITEFKGSSFSIGGPQVSEPNYQTMKLELKKKDRIYLTSDGYADQFGGRSNKKIYTRGLKQLLENTATFGMLAQKIFLNGYLEEWRKNLEQTDDILLMGIEI